MSRLIDADELIKAAREYFEYYTDFCDFVKLIDQAPTVDQWHYPSRGEYPTDGEEVLFRCDGQNYLGTYSDTSHYFDSRDMGSPADYVACWQYIVPPKEEE